MLQFSQVVAVYNLGKGAVSVDFYLGKNLLSDTIKGADPDFDNAFNIQVGDRLTCTAQGRIISIVVKYDDDSGDIRTITVINGQGRDY